MFDIFKRAAHLSHIELCGLVLSSRPLADGRSPQSRAADRSWVSRFIVRAPVGTLQQRYFAEYGTSAARIMSQLALRQRNPMDSTAVINMVCGPAGEPMVRALEECHQDTNLYRNALDRLSQAAELMPAERAEAVLVLFVAVGCSADVRSSVNFAIDYAHATCGGGTSTPRSLGMSMTAGERDPAPAHPLGLLRIQNSFVVSAPRWIQPSEQGVEIGALATGEGDITDVGDDVSARHAHIWCDAQNIWHVEDLSSHQRNRGGKRGHACLHSGRARPFRPTQSRRRAQARRIHYLRHPLRCPLASPAKWSLRPQGIILLPAVTRGKPLPPAYICRNYT